VPVTNLTGQSWANGGTAQHPNRWAIISPTFNTALTSSDLVSTWVSRLNTIWANASSDAAGRLTGTSLQNINAFIDPKSNPIPWQLPAAQFGLQSVVFSGKAATYRTNFGNGGAFSLVNGSLIDFQPGPT
jgi:hypothetical protein